MEVTVYVCPHEDCTNYYGASSMPELEVQPAAWKPDINTAPWNTAEEAIEQKGSRADCPDCRAQNRGRVRRQRVTVDVKVPAAA